MRRAVVVASLLTLTALGAAVIQRPPPLWVRGRVTGGSTPPPAPFVQDLQYAVQAPSVPACNWSEACQMSCRVNDAGTLWECWLADGGAVASVTQGTGTQFRRSQFGVNTMQDVTSASHPYLTSDAINSMWGGDWTMTMGGYGTSLTHATLQHIFEVNSPLQGVTIRNEGGSMRAYVTGLSAYISVDTASRAADGWGLLSLRRANGFFSDGINGYEASFIADTTGMAAFSAGSVYEFGDRQAAGYPLRGPLAFANFYSSGDAGIIERDRRRLLGLPETTTFTAATAAPFLCLNYDGGASECFLSSGALVGPRGFSTQRGAVTVNKMGSSNIDPTVWATVGSPTVTANAASGPFYVFRNQNECAMVVDHDAGAAGFEGNISADGYVANTLASDGYTFWAYLGQGDSGTTTDKARLQIDVTGGGWDDAGTTFVCDKTLASSGVGVYSCQSPPFVVDAGSPTVKGSLLVGNTGSDVGAVVACGAALTPRPWIEPLPMTNTDFGNSVQTINPAAWAFVGGGKVEVVFSSLYDISSASGYGAGSVLYLFDAYDASPTHNILMVLGYSQAGEILARLGDTAGPFTDLIATGVSLVPNAFTVISLEWRGSSTCDAVLRLDTCADPATCHASTSIATATAGTCPTAPTGVKLGNRYDNTVPTSTNVYSVTTYHL